MLVIGFGVLPAVSIKKYANSMSLLKADMPIGHKDPPKDVDGGMAELKEPGEEGQDRHHFEEDERLAQDCLVHQENDRHLIFPDSICHIKTL